MVDFEAGKVGTRPQRPPYVDLRSGKGWVDQISQAFEMVGISEFRSQMLKALPRPGRLETTSPTQLVGSFEL